MQMHLKKKMYLEGFENWIWNKELCRYAQES